MSKITLSIIVDKKYIEPALVTLKNLLKFKNFYKSLKFILIKKNLDSAEDMNEILDLFHKFKNSFDDDNFIEFIVVENKFPEFTKFHFSNAILYKIFLPVILKDEEFILNVDAGNLFQNGFYDFSQNLYKLIRHSTEFTVGAFLQSSNLQMPEEISKYSIHYPSAGLLLFNTKKYHYNSTSDRIIGFYNDNASYLTYAEQEILCGVLNDTEFYRFEKSEYVYLDDLSTYVGENYLPINYEKLNISIFYKNQGSLKPWKVWNLNPNRAIYLKARNEISKFIDLNQYNFIREERESISENLIMYKSANLIAYENELIKKT
jgi:lipopolysaccharide biosynthesis glycosyltransferase